VITDSRLERATLKAAHSGVPAKTIQRLLHVAGCNKARDLPLTRRRDFLEVLADLQRPPRQE
jgi:hypothetical protein